MIVHNFDPVLFDLGFFQIRWYSLAYIFGIIFGWIYSNIIIKNISNNKFGFTTINNNEFDNLVIYIIIGIIIGGRLGYVLFYNLDFFTGNISEIFKIWNGGMSFHGGLVGLIIAALVFSKSIGINFFKISDILACVSPIGIFLGRIANFINGELYGKITNVPWAIVFPDAGSLPRHPSQIYEALLEGFVLFLIINYLAIKKEFLFKSGQISGFFLIFYSIFRIISEIFREPDLHLGYFFNYLSMGTILSILTLLAGCIIIFVKKNE
tara:strand:+ start:2507 stop:3304 length:798 start_codon:yes stop_codon:yes gene_type:complete